MQCRKHFKEVSTRFEKNNTEKYCYICGNSNKLYVCGDEDCTSAFCKKCIKRNVSLSLLAAEKDDWKCFTCNPKPIWQLRAVCAVVMSDLSKGHNRRDTHTREKHTLPFDKQRFRKTREIQKALSAFCDEDDDDGNYSDNSSFLTARSTISMLGACNTNRDVKRQDTNSASRESILEISLVDSTSSESSSSSRERRGEQRKSREREKARSVDEQDSSSGVAQRVSKLAMNGKCKPRRNVISSDDSDDESPDLSRTVRQKHTVKHKKSEEVRSKTSNRNYTNSSDSESDCVNETSNTSKSLSKYTAHQKKGKIAGGSCSTKSAKDKQKKMNHDSSNESEDDLEHKKQTKKKSSTNNTLHSKDEQKQENREKLLKRTFCETREDDSDASSGKEFQKIKIQKLHSDKYSKRQLFNLEQDRSKLTNLETEKGERSIDEPTTSGFNEAKEILKGCKKICLSFLMYIDSIEQLYGKKAEEEVILKSAGKVNKLKTMLEKKERDLTTFCQSCSKTRENRVATRNSRKIISDDDDDDEQVSEITDTREERPMSENGRNSGNEREGKDVSECDSEEIFSADEMRTPQKMQSKKSISRVEDDPDDITTEIGKDRMPIDKSKTNDNVDLQDEKSAAVSSISKEKNIRTENTKSNEKQLLRECDSNSKRTELAEKDTDSKDEKQAKLNANNHDNESTFEDSSAKNGNQETTLRGDNQDDSISRTVAIDVSLDLFDSSFDLHDEDENEMEAEKMDTETSCEKTKFLSKTTSLDTRETSLQDKIPDEKNNASALVPRGEEEDLSNQVNTVSACTSKETIHDGSKEIDTSKEMSLGDVNKSVDEAEMLAKKALLESDTDSDTDTVINKNITKQTEDLITDTSPRKDETEGCSDVSSTTSTVKLSTFAKSKIDTTIEVTDASEESQLDKTAGKESEISQTSDETNAKKEQAAKKALLESTSEDSSSIILSSLESEEIEEKSRLDVARENAEAKKALLASSNSESSGLVSETEINISKRMTKAKDYEADSDEDSLISRVKKRRLKLSKNYHYKKDKKLRMFCEVCLERLSDNVLKRYSKTLKESREYLEQKALKSLINLDRLEKRYKKNKKIDSDTSTDDDKAAKVLKSLNKRKGNQTKEESLMDHLKKIENDEVSAIVRTDSSSDEFIHQVNDINATPVSNEALMSEANKVAKDNLLKSSDSDAGGDVLNSEDDISNDDKKLEDKKKKHQKKSDEKTLKQDDGKKEKTNKSNWRQNKLLTMKFSDTDSDNEKKKWDKKQEKMAKGSERNSSDTDDEKARLTSKKKKIKRRILDSDSDVKLTDCSSDSNNISETSKDEENLSDSDARKEKQKRKRRKRGESNSSGTDSSFQEKKSKPKRKRIKKMASDSDSSDGDMKNSQGSTPGKSGRKNIRKVLKDKQVAEDTKLAAKEEEERLKRIAERQALYNEVYEMRLAGEEKVDKLVLDFNTETKEELISVHKELVKCLKPHQAQGIKFMWDACFESIERVKTTSGSGCIIAHCMGLGKTLQVVALTHALLTHEATGVKTVLIVCPLSTVLNWLNEYNTWLKNLDDINVYELTKFKKNFERKYQLQNWQQTGGVMILGYDMFRNLTGPNKNIRKAMKEVILECLVEPGADLVVCDEGHLLKNEETALSKCMRRVKTMRRIVLTGTPLQNNLIEYHCMVQFVKPNLLGTRKEFLNRFVNPITNGQFDDSTAYDVKLMKKRAHVLHKMLEGSVQRFDYSVLTPFLPPKQEFVIFVRLTDIQMKMYQYYLDNLARRHHSGAGGTLFADFQALQRIWTHPVVLRLNAEKVEKANEKKGLSDSEGSLKDFIDDGSLSSSSSSDSHSDSDVQALDDQDNVPKRRTRNNPGEEEPEEETKEEENKEAEWWSQFVQPEHFEDIRVSAKLTLLFGILKECEQIGDKVLVFSQSLYSLTLIEEFLARIDDETQKNASLDTLENHTGSWSLGLDYFRLDGQTSPENRSMWCKIFNKPNNIRARLFLISTRAGGLGINLTAANRVIIFDASWNPSHDVQSIFRIYRFGQKKPCYVYRFLAAGTMEEKIYNRQVTKLSLSCRVVDEQQIERHYSNHNLNELYIFEPYDNVDKPIEQRFNIPKDRLLAEIFQKYQNIIENYHEHDSLLENKAEEELDEEERKQAWLEYEEEKKGRPMINPTINSAYQNNILLQQYNMMMNSGQSSMVSPGMSLQMEYENLQQLIRKDYPNATPEQQKMMTNRAIMEMYNYWEKQATLGNTFPPARNLTTVTQTNFQQRPMPMSHTMTNSNVQQQQTSQLSQLLASGQTGNYVNKSVQPNVAQRDMLPNMYRNAPSTNSAGKADDDIIEVIPTTSNAGTLKVGQVAMQSTMQSTNKSNNQEE
ncbi:transcriptional regulator ATRX isoform X3 [Ooceraea biroi]|nr:transcriptional regulator ATRX isoform X3 [Ooceraea biroi]XP_011344209.2 transcriptional regulator ATRX isoform X3 [Ooceraea biroi]